MDPHTKALLKEAAQGIEDALHLIRRGQQPSVTLEYLTPAARLRQQADALDYMDIKVAELCDLRNRLLEASKKSN